MESSSCHGGVSEYANATLAGGTADYITAASTLASK
jgi:hypothetical protein